MGDLQNRTKLTVSNGKMQLTSIFLGLYQSVDNVFCLEWKVHHNLLQSPRLDIDQERLG